MDFEAQTIVATATPPGQGGVGIVRVSGNLSLAIAKLITKRSVIKPKISYFSSFYEENEEVIDHGLVFYFEAPNSFTGEDVIEFHAHGSPIVLDMLINRCLTLGAKLAEPGEFSKRAFLNNKIDLTQAEAIADLISANSHVAAKMAVRSLQGDFSKAISIINEKLISLRTFVEAAIDFPDEEIDFLSDGKVKERLQIIIDELVTLKSKAQQGVLLQEGLNIVIAGPPNAGKSTLMNSLAKRDVSIVTPVAGTTRDVMRERILLDDIPVHLADTAGLHNSNNEIEQEGIKRAWQEINKADFILLLQDLSNDSCSDLSNEIIANLPKNVPIITVFNKIDKNALPNKLNDKEVAISAKIGTGLSDLISLIKKQAGYKSTEGQFLARRRHLQSLNLAHNYLEQGMKQLDNFKASELLAEDLRLSQLELSTITGKFTADDLLGVIFSEFCIGK